MARLFHALVVMGSSLGISNCGGEASDRDGPNALAGSAGEQPGSGGLGVGGAVGLSGTVGFGGADFQIGGQPTSSGGGALGDGGGWTDTAEGGSGGAPDADSIEQWNCAMSCEDVNVGAATYSAVSVDASRCVMDRARPKSSADCGSNEWFECRLGIYEGNQVLVNCTCTPMLGADCSCRHGETVSCEANDKVCSCAITGILVK